MIQVKIITTKELATLDCKANEFLATLDEDAEPSVNVDIEKGVVTIVYKVREEYLKRMCCDCQYWDDGGETGTVGICQEHGQRRRFNYKACKCFKDVRG